MRGRPLTAVTALALVVLGLVGCSRAEDQARAALAEFLTGWPAGDLAKVAFIDLDGESVAPPEVAESIAALSGELAPSPPKLTAGEISVVNGEATAEVAVAWPLPIGGTWDYTTTVRLSEQDGDWRVSWHPAVVHPELLPGDTLALRREPTIRGEILDGAGQPLVTAREVVEVGIWPAQVEDLDDELSGLATAMRLVEVKLDPAVLANRVAAAGADHFVPVVTLRKADFDLVSEQLRPLPGLTVQETERHLAPTRTFARALLGTVDPVTAEDMERDPGAYVPSDYVGHGGLSGYYDEQLRGTVGQRVVIARPDAAGADGTDIELHRVEPTPGVDLVTTLDQATQRAAEQALATEPNTAALVAIRVSDGAVLAVANTIGAEANPVNLALTAQVPPGSTFKLVSAYALLAGGQVALDDRVPCPEEFIVDGRRFTNANGFGLGEVPFRTAVARSCNTTFAALAPTLGPDGLAAAGAELGLDDEWDLGVETFTGTVPRDGSAAEQAAAAFGQGATVVSPVAMAAVTAAVARGAWLPPTLLVDPAQGKPTPVPLPKSIVADLHTALREVVTVGTATELSEVPGGEVRGKTGTAEYADGVDDTHAWFIGWQGDIAFAVFVQDGGSSTDTAVPLAAEFLRDLN